MALKRLRTKIKFAPFSIMKFIYSLSSVIHFVSTMEVSKLVFSLSNVIHFVSTMELLKLAHYLKKTQVSIAPL